METIEISYLDNEDWANKGYIPKKVIDEFIESHRDCIITIVSEGRYYEYATAIRLTTEEEHEFLAGLERKGSKRFE